MRRHRQFTRVIPGVHQFHRFGGNLRGPFFPSVATDRTGRVYITWPDCRFRPSCASNDMVLTTSADGVHGGTRPASPAGARSFAAAGRPGLTR